MFSNNVQQFFQDSENLSHIFSCDYNEIIVRILHKFKNSIINEIPNEFLIKYPILRKIPERFINLSFHLFKEFFSSVDFILKYIDIKNPSAPFSSLLINCKSALPLELVDSIVEKQIRGNICEYNEKLHIVFNRSKAALFITNSNHPKSKSLLSQLIHQIPKEPIHKMIHINDSPWHVDLEGEGAADAGGPARELFSQVCQEFMNPISNYFMRTPNGINGIGDNQDILIPNPYNLDEEKQRDLFYIGAIIGCAYTSKLSQPFQFAKLFWYYLINKKLKIKHVYEIDEKFKNFKKDILESTKEVFDSLNITYTVYDSGYHIVELVDYGKMKKVNYEDRFHYCDLCE